MQTTICVKNIEVHLVQVRPKTTNIFVNSLLILFRKTKNIYYYLHNKICEKIAINEIIEKNRNLDLGGLVRVDDSKIFCQFFYQFLLFPFLKCIMRKHVQP